MSSSRTKNGLGSSDSKKDERRAPKGDPILEEPTIVGPAKSQLNIHSVSRDSKGNLVTVDGVAAEEGGPLGPVAGAHSTPTRDHPNLYKKAEAQLKSLREMFDRNDLRFIKQLNKGGQGVVYLAEHKNLGGFRAVKMISSNDVEFHARLWDEARNLARLSDHPNVVKVYDLKVDEKEGDILMIMEYLKGSELFTVIYQEGPMEWERAKGIVLQICDGIQAAHEYTDEEGVKKPIIHRDLKPENIFLIKNNGHGEVVKIIDFGLSKTDAADKRAMTMENAVFGSPEYMSPEQGRGEAVDTRTDIFSLGAVIYHLVAGTPPYHVPDDTPDNARWAIIGAKLVSSESVEPPTQRNPGLEIPADVEALIMKCLEKEPGKRFQSMAELKEAVMNARPYVAPRGEAVGAAGNRQADSASGDAVSPWASNGGEAIDPADLPSSHLPPAGSVQLSKSMMLEVGKMPTDMELPPVQKNAPGQAATPEAAQAADPARGKPTILTDRKKLAIERRKKGRMIIGSAVLAGVGILATGTYFATRKPHVDQSVVTSPVADAHPVETARPVPPVVDSGAPRAPPLVPPPVPRVISHTITFTTNVDGVEVLRGDERECMTSSRTCSIDLTEGTDEVTFTLRKRGYRDREVSVTPDGDHRLNVRLERERRPASPNNQHPQDNPLLQMRPNYKK